LQEDKIYNMENLLELTGGDPDFIREMIHVFISQSDAFLKDIKSAVIAGDIEALKHKAHKYKTSAQLFQIQSLHTSLAKLESHADFSRKQEINILLKEIEKISAEAVSQLKEELEKY
jgi:HPt (histidine-containing phosphotransfer) domain-containing protein